MSNRCHTHQYFEPLDEQEHRRGNAGYTVDDRYRN